jgi:hypothetical protein
MPFKFNPLSGNLDYYEVGSGGSGDVVGPGSSTDNAIARYDGTTGKLLQDSLVKVDDTGNVNAPNNGFYKGRNLADTVDVDLIGVDSADNIIIGESTGYNVRVKSANLISDVDGQCNLGSGANSFGTLYVAGVGTLLQWVSNNATLRTAAAAVTFAINLLSGDSSAGNSGNVTVASGSATGGNSGDVILQSGGATGTRGKVRVRNSTEGPAGHILVSNDTTGGTSWVAPTTAYDINALTADTPVTADFIPFYDTSGADSNKSTIANMQTAFWQTVANVAHVKTDGTGTHSTLLAASLDAAIKTVLIYPGTHNIDNSVSPLNIGSKTYVGIGLTKATILTRTDKTKVALTLTVNGNITGVQLGDGSVAENACTEFFAIYTVPGTTTAIYKDIVIQAGLGILIRNATGLTLKNITSNGNFFTFNPTTAIQIGDALTTSPAVMSIQDCSMNLASYPLVKVYNAGSLSIFNLVTDFSLGGSASVEILSTCTGTTSLFNCYHNSVGAGVIIDGTSGAKLEITGDAYGQSIYTANVIASNGAKVSFQGPSMYEIAGALYTDDATCQITGTIFNKTTGAVSLSSVGASPSVGNAILVAGTKTVTTAAIKSSSIVILSRKTAGGTLGNLTYTITAGTSFTINSSSATDTSTVSWQILGAY